jgi:hypothetical protein
MELRWPVLFELDICYPGFATVIFGRKGGPSSTFILLNRALELDIAGRDRPQVVCPLRWLAF